jgi:hypothetical protein
MKPELPRCSDEHDYSNRQPQLEFADGGRYLRVKFRSSLVAEWNREMFQRPVYERGKCKGFSFSSRRRLLDRLNSVSVAAELPCFLTLTVPDEVFTDDCAEFSKRAKVWLDTFLKRLRRVEPKSCGFWRIEWQARKSGEHEGKLVPHFHMLLWGLPKRLLGTRPEYGETEDGRRVVFGEKEVWEFYVRTPDRQLSLELLNLWSRPQAEDGEALPDGQQRVWMGPTSDGDMPAFTFEGSTKFVRRCESLHSRVMLEGAASSAKIQGADYARNMSFQDWASLAWYHVVASGNLDHLSAGTRVETLRSWGGAMAYAAKYLGKAHAGFLSEVEGGRNWGIFNRVEMPWAKMIELELPEEVGVRLRRVARRYLERRLGRRVNKPYGVTVYCDVQQFRKLWEEPPPDPF